MWECDAATAGNCFLIDINYSSDGFLYDTSTGYNYFFFRQIFVEKDLTRLSDANYFRIEGIVQDTEKKHQFTKNPLLAGKCASYESADFFANMLAAMNHYLFGCSANGTTPPIVTMDANTTHEKRILIEVNHPISPPTQECFACLNADRNNVYVDSLKQDLYCFSVYTLGEASVDKFKLIIENENSDLSAKEFQQFLEIEVPYELVYFNDVSLMKKSMEAEFGTKINTLGDLIFSGINYLASGTLNILTHIPKKLTANGIINNVGFDCNFSKAFDPNNLTGVFIYKIKGLKVINQKDFEGNNPELESLDPKFFRKFAAIENINLPDEETIIEVFASDMVKVATYTVPSFLVINEEVDQSTIRRENLNLDTNQEAPAYETAPTVLRFNFISDLIYDNERQTIRRFVPITLSVILVKNCGLFGLNCTGGIIDIFTRGDISWIINNWFLLFMAIVTLLVFGMIWRYYRGNSTIINARR